MYKYQGNNVFAPFKLRKMRSEDQRSVHPSFYFQRKSFRPSETIDKYKSRLVATGTIRIKIFSDKKSSTVANDAVIMVHILNARDR